MAWLLAQAVTGGEMTPAKSAAATAAVTSIVEQIAADIDPALAGEFRRLAMTQFKTLHADALYPAMKEPISAEARKVLIDRFAEITKRVGTELDEVRAKFGAKPVVLAGEIVSITHSLVTALIFQLTFDRIGPSRTEYWGTMKVVEYSPDRFTTSRWPVSVAMIPDEAMNRLLGWKRGESLKEIGRAFDRGSSSIYGQLSPTGGIRPLPRRQAMLGALQSLLKQILDRCAKR